MADDQGLMWSGYAPSVTTSRKYAVKYRSGKGWWVTCTLIDRRTGWVVTLYSLGQHPEIIDHIPSGGSFFVNEWKQVLKPTGNELREVRYIGEFPSLHFRFAYGNRILDNAQTEGLRPGDPWEHQEVGMRYSYNLSEGLVSRRVVRVEDGYEYEAREDVRPHQRLLDAFGRARPERMAGRFYANEHGVVVLPALFPDELPVFVGRVEISKDSWFVKKKMAQARPNSGRWPPEWVDVLDLCQPSLEPLLVELRRRGVPVPVVGYDVTAKNKVVATAELAWPKQRVAFFLQGQKRHDTQCRNQGWDVFVKDDKANLAGRIALALMDYPR